MKRIGPFSQVVTLRGLPEKGALVDGQLEILERGGVVVEHGRIVDIGPFDGLAFRYKQAETVPIQGEHVLIPGFVDCHTHCCFAGSRAKDYAMRVAGKSYLEIAQAGGGIWDSVVQTRAASIGELARKTAARANRLVLGNGVTTIEVKSGYGLDVANELKMLRAIAEASLFTPADLIATCLAAHLKPPDFDGDGISYLEHVVTTLLPVVKQESLSNRVDIFVEESAFGTAEAKRYLQQAKAMGFAITVHADQFSVGGSKLAVECGALSADHLEASSTSEIALLAHSDTVAVALPGASMGLGIGFAPARRMLDAGACLAIASDWNPGSAPMGNLLLQAAVLGMYEKLTLAETLAAITYRAARALGLVDRGVLDAGKRADMQAYPTSDYRDILYLQGTMTPTMVWINGECIQ